MDQQPSPAADLISQLHEAEGDLAAVMTRVRHLLAQSEDETRRALARAEAVKFTTISEHDAAAAFGDHVVTFRERVAEHNFPYLQVGRERRYTNEHLMEIAEIFERIAADGRGHLRRAS